MIVKDKIDQPDEWNLGGDLPESEQGDLPVPPDVKLQPTIKRSPKKKLPTVMELLNSNAQ